MNELEKILNEKKTENGDKAYKTTGNNLTDLLFMSEYFSKHLDEARIGTSEKEKLFSMFMRDPRYGLGKRDLGRRLMRLSGVSAENVVKAGRYDDLYNIATDEMLMFLKEQVMSGNELAKKWMPRLTGKDRKIAKAICKIWGIREKKYRELIKTNSTVEYKLSYAEETEATVLDDLFKKYRYTHPLVKDIDFEKVPSLAMHKYLRTFSTREDLKERFAAYIEAVKANKAKVNTKTANVYDAYKTATMDCMTTQSVRENADVIAKKTVENATIGVELNAIPILDTSASMTWGGNLLEKATSIAHGIATHSTYAKNQLISFSSYPQLMTIKGETLREQYRSMFTGDCSNTDFGAVMKLLQKLEKYPEYLVVLSDMEFDQGSNQSKAETMKIFKEHGAETKIIWWNLNDRNKTVPEFDEYGNIYLSGYNLQLLKLLENKFDMTSYIDKLLREYAKNIDIKINL
mgnify:FL=1